MAPHYFNILTFEQAQDELTLYFTNVENENLTRVHRNLVPDEVIENFEEVEEHKFYYTSFDIEMEGLFPVTKLIKYKFEAQVDEYGEERYRKVHNSAFKTSLLKRYFNAQVHNYFKGEDFLVKPNFIRDTEVWLPSNKHEQTGLFNLYDRYSLKVQFRSVTKGWELLVTFEGVSKVYKQSVYELQETVSPTSFIWVIFENNLYRFDELPSAGRRDYENVFPVWNFGIRDALGEPTLAPVRSNKYKKFKTAIEYFYSTYLDTEEFRNIIPITAEGFIPVEEKRLGKVKSNSNKLLFGEGNTGIVPMNGMKEYGPFELSATSNLHFFFIYHNDDKEVAMKMNSFFIGEERGFGGLSKFIHTTYHTEPGFSITYEDRENPWPEIYKAVNDKYFKPDVQYFAIYISPFSKNTSDLANRKVYYKLKELLLKKKISSQVIDAEKVKNNAQYFYSLPNIAIAILAKLRGIPWRLDNAAKKELIVGVGAFKNPDFDVRYIGSAFSFSNNGKFNRFECFQQDQIQELAGSIIRTVKEYAEVNPDIERLVIHFYKSMSNRELEPIEKGLKTLGLDIPVFIVTVNKTASTDIIAFDTSWDGLMPLSGTYINVGYNKYLLFNNTRYSAGIYKSHEGFPFPIKLKIECTQAELTKDTKITKELLDQVYQFSRMYWKSVSQQNLPVTIKYPEMVAEMLPHFEGNEIPDFGKDNLWFL